MAKIENDKYYTPIDLANKCWDNVAKFIDMKNVTDVIEPSCGNGAFFHHPIYIPNIGYDICPEISGNNIIQADYLNVDIDYCQGRLIIGNPPYGSRMNLAQKFYKKSIKIADYIAFILPISQLNNTNSMYEFDLVHSEDLGVRKYSGISLHCCFNIYKRPESGVLNNKPRKKLSDISIYRQDSKDYINKPYNVCMCYWGDGSCGKIVETPGKYSAEYKIKVNNTEHRDEIVNFIKSYDWREYVNCIASKKIQQFHIIDALIKEFQWIK